MKAMRNRRCSRTPTPRPGANPSSCRPPFNTRGARDGPLYSPDMNVEWFRDHVARLSRQVLTTMGKPIGVKPYRRDGQWRFRTADGDDRTLEEVFAALQADPRGRQRLVDE